MPDSAVYYCIRLELSNRDISSAISVSKVFVLMHVLLEPYSKKEWRQRYRSSRLEKNRGKNHSSAIAAVTLHDSSRIFLTLLDIYCDS